MIKHYENNCIGKNRHDKCARNVKKDNSTHLRIFFSCTNVIPCMLVKSFKLVYCGDYFCYIFFIFISNDKQIFNVMLLRRYYSDCSDSVTCFPLYFIKLYFVRNLRLLVPE